MGCLWLPEVWSLFDRCALVFVGEVQPELAVCAWIVGGCPSVTWPMFFCRHSELKSGSQCFGLVVLVYTLTPSRLVKC